MKNENFLSRLIARKQSENHENTEATFLDEASVPTTAQMLPHTLVTFTPEQDEQLTEDEKLTLQSKVLKLPPVRVGELNFVPFEAGSLHGGYYVKVFIRNGRDIQEDITLKELPLFLVDASGEKVAGGVFRPEGFGVLKFGETRVWTFAWHTDQVYKKNADLSKFTVLFE